MPTLSEDVNWRATAWALGAGLVGSFLVTWWNEANSLKGYADLVGFQFVTKYVGTLVIQGGIGAVLAHSDFRGKDPHTRKYDVPDVLKRGNGPLV